MALKVIKETIELETFRTDATGSCYITKRINLQEGKAHTLLQTDFHADAYVNSVTGALPIEIVISPYPSIPTDMIVTDQFPNPGRLVAGGDDSVLFKINGTLNEGNPLVTGVDPVSYKQFPSAQIAANQKLVFYSDHVYITVHISGNANTTFYNLALSFMLVSEDKTTTNLTHGIGVLAESHNAMCALVMSNGHMISQNVLRGNVFPMWRFGGIRPEHMITPIAANAYFLPINTRDAEQMTSTPGIRQAVADSRQMSAFDAPFGDRRPDWIRLHLNAGVVAGPIRDQWPPIKHADNGNVRML